MQTPREILADLWTLAGVCAVQEMQGPIIPWRPGRQDRDASFCTPDGRLPDASKEQNHIRAIFGRMGFNDQEMVALSGAHALGMFNHSSSKLIFDFANPPVQGVATPTAPASMALGPSHRQS